jgi:predicted pyridoxine 5'-phosphate oxidase superfamily flavin-nucleotide-binding protein
MKINEQMKAVVEGSAFITLVTLCADGKPHPIVSGKGAVKGDTIVFGIYKMEKTQKNLAADPSAWIVAATRDGGPKGYRFSGTAAAQGGQLIFTPSDAEPLM